MRECVCVSRSVVSNSLWSHGAQSTGSSVHGILQARILEWVAISESLSFSIYLRKPICCCALAMFQIVVSLETFFSCSMTCSVKSQVFSSSFVENLSHGKISKVTFLFWQQMAVFSGTIVVYLLSTKESYTVFLSGTTALHHELVHTGALGLHRIFFFFFCNRKRKS